MPTLNLILPLANAPIAKEGEAGLVPPGSSDVCGEPFGDLISRALSPDSPPAGVRAGQKNSAPSGKGPCHPPMRAVTAVVTDGVAMKSDCDTVPATSTKTASSPGEHKGEKREDSASELSAGIAARITAAVPQVAANQLIATTISGSAPPFVSPTTFKNNASSGAKPEAISAVKLTAPLAARDPSSSATNVTGPGAPADNAAPVSIADIESGKAQTITVMADALSGEKANSSDSNVNDSPGGKSSDPLVKDAPTPQLSEVSSLASAGIPRETGKSGNQNSLMEDVNASPNSAGTYVAKMDVAMKNADKTNKIAGAAEKILPGNAVSPASKNNLPAREPPASALPHRPQPEIVASTAPMSFDAKPGTATPVANIATASAVTPHTQTVERAHDMIVVQTARLQDFDLDSLRVVIKPGSGAQLSLELRQHGDSVNAQAVLQRGDFNHMNQHWPELQQRLEQRGIRLAPLASHENPASFGGNNGFQRQPRQDGAESGSFLGVGRLALSEAALQCVATTTVPAQTHRGWESWA